MKMYIVFQHGNFNPEYEAERVKGVFDSLGKAQECKHTFDSLYRQFESRTTKISIETFEVNEITNM